MPVEVRLSGSGGQGLILAGMVLAEACGLEGKYCAQSQAYEPVSRGGWSRTDVVVSEGPIDYPLATALDALLLLHPDGAQDSLALMKAGGRVLADSSAGEALSGEPPSQSNPSRIVLPLIETARSLGHPRAANMAALGALAGMGGICAIEPLREAIQSKTASRFQAANLEALEAGYRLTQGEG